MPRATSSAIDPDAATVAYVRERLAAARRQASEGVRDPGDATRRSMSDDAEARARMETWVDRARTFPLERVHAATGQRGIVRSEARAFDGRIAHLRRLLAANPDLADRYSAKIADMEKKKGIASAPEPREKMLAFVDTELVALDEALASRGFLAGATYSLAEVYWTPVLGRLDMLGLHDRLVRLPNVARWWSALRARPSFERADIWTQLKPWVLAPFVARLIAPYLAVALFAVVALCLVICWLVGR